MARKPEVIRCPHCGARRRRTSKANAYYWALLHAISEQVKPEGKQYGVEEWHTYFKTRFLPGVEERVLPNGKTIVIPPSSSDLPEDKFAHYTEQVYEWAVVGRGVIFSREDE